MSAARCCLALHCVRIALVSLSNYLHLIVILHHHFQYFSDQTQTRPHVHYALCFMNVSDETI